MGIENRILSLVQTLKDSIDSKWGHWIDQSLEFGPDATLLADVCKGFGFKFQPIKRNSWYTSAQIERRARNFYLLIVEEIWSLSSRSHFFLFFLLWVLVCSTFFFLTSGSVSYFCFVIISGAWLTLYLISVFYLKSLRKAFFSLGCYIICGSVIHV